MYSSIDERYSPFIDGEAEEECGVENDEETDDE